jgi:hypothetical protein
VGGRRSGLFSIGVWRDIIGVAVPWRSVPLVIWKNVTRGFTKVLFIAVGITFWTGLVVLFSYVALSLVKF